jgi:uncharacterized membrane protein
MAFLPRTSSWLRRRYLFVVGSIAFVPAVVAIGFLLLSFAMLELDFSEFGKHIKASVSWISLQDASTARNISSTVAAGIISLLVFSFSMVMILLNQTASKMSNRVLSSLISNRFQQTVLGVYLGTIVYALSLLSTVRDVDTGIYVPALSIYLLIFFTIADIFLFIYFIHYVTQSVKYEVIIQRVHDETRNALDQYCSKPAAIPQERPDDAGMMLPAESSGYYQGFRPQQLMAFCTRHDVTLQVLPLLGSFVLKAAPFLKIHGHRALSPEAIAECLSLFDFFDGQPIATNPANGFHQLKEIAVKALSPGINDPGTAQLCIDALTDLLAFRIAHHPDAVRLDDDGRPRILTREMSFSELLQECFLSIWDYAKQDRTVMQGMKSELEQLAAVASEPHDRACIEEMLRRVMLSLDDIKTRECIG